MARIICSICGWNSQEHPDVGRTGHLKHEHNIAPYNGVVEDYFLHPWEAATHTYNNKPQHSFTCRRSQSNGRPGPESPSGNERADSAALQRAALEEKKIE